MGKRKAGAVELIFLCFQKYSCFQGKECAVILIAPTIDSELASNGYLQQVMLYKHPWLPFFFFFSVLGHFLMYLMISSIRTSGNGSKTTRAGNTHPFVTFDKNLWSIGRQIRNQDHLLSVRNQKILYWKLAIGCHFGIMGQYAFLISFLCAPFCCVFLIFFFLILSLLFSFLPCFDWQPWATIVLRFSKKSILLNFVNLSTIFCPRLKEENLQFLKFKYFVRQNFDNNCRSAQYLFYKRSLLLSGFIVLELHSEYNDCFLTKQGIQQ